MCIYVNRQSLCPHAHVYLNIYICIYIYVYMIYIYMILNIVKKIYIYYTNINASLWDLVGSNRETLGLTNQ